MCFVGVDLDVLIFFEFWTAKMNVTNHQASETSWKNDVFRCQGAEMI